MAFVLIVQATPNMVSINNIRASVLQVDKEQVREFTAGTGPTTIRIYNNSHLAVLPTPLLQLLDTINNLLPPPIQDITDDPLEVSKKKKKNILDGLEDAIPATCTAYGLWLALR